jgi:citrate lyase subunit beta/citryl-CoA lyase
VLHLDAIGALSKSTRLALWVLGLNDLAKEMRAKPDASRAIFHPFMAMAVAAARCHHISVLDAVCNEFRNIEAFAAEAMQGAAFGFDGKSLIHPDQIAPCNAAFSPSAEELAQAQAIIEAFALPEHQDKGVIQVGGQMVELLHQTQAQALLKRAKRMGLIAKDSDFLFSQ